ncbi:MAG: sigma-70 family RNA polymerase sigma factor [Bryobacterales bacterium]|nr:sigma-70 family RNA polymerase sigma factor [Bryobacterales bacterium]
MDIVNVNRTPANFHDLWTAHAGAVRRFAIGLTGNPALADDLTAEAFTRLWSGWDSVRLPTVRAYLYTIVRNLHLQQSRRRRREDLLPDDLPRQDSIETQVADRQVLAQLSRHLLELPEPDRAALLLRAVEGLPYEAIAIMLQLSAANVRVRVHRARQRLATLTQRSDVK